MCGKGNRKEWIKRKGSRRKLGNHEYLGEYMNEGGE